MQSIIVTLHLDCEIMFKTSAPSGKAQNVQVNFISTGLGINVTNKFLV